ncbi:MAG TPA: hypothetical protein VF834_18055 [Streptosporangiaceae bacterium]
MAAGYVAHATNFSIRASREHSARMSAVWMCAGFAYLVDTLVVPSYSASLWPKVAVSALSIAGLAIASWAWLSLTTTTRSAWAGYAGLSVRSPLVRGWQRALQPPPQPLADSPAPRNTRQLLWLGYVPALEVSYRETLARYGPQPAAETLRARKAGFVARCASWVLAIFWLCSVNIYYGLASWAWVLTFFGVSIVGLIAAFAAMIISLRAARLQLGLMIEATGAENLTRLSEPWRPSEYVAWCRTNGVQPYPFGRPDWREIDG